MSVPKTKTTFPFEKMNFVEFSANGIRHIRYSAFNYSPISTFNRYFENNQTLGGLKYASLRNNAYAKRSAKKRHREFSMKIHSDFRPHLKLARRKKPYKAIASKRERARESQSRIIRCSRTRPRIKRFVERDLSQKVDRETRVPYCPPPSSPLAKLEFRSCKVRQPHLRLSLFHRSLFFFDLSRVVV